MRLRWYCLLGVVGVVLGWVACNKHEGKVLPSKKRLERIFELPNETLAIPQRVPLSKRKAPKQTIVRFRKANLPVVSRYLNGTPLLDQTAAGVGMFTTFDTDNGLALDALGYGKSLFCDRNGILWMGTMGGGVSRYDGKNFITYTTANGLANNSVLCITEDKSGNIWLGTGGGGVSRYDGHKFTTFTTSDGLADDAVISIHEDKRGRIWFGTYGQGVSCFNGKSFQTFTTAQGLAGDIVRSIEEDQYGNLWFGTAEKGVSRYNGNRFQTFDTRNGLTNNTVLAMVKDQVGNLWLATQQGINWFDGNQFHALSIGHGLPDTSVWSLATDRTGAIWIGTESGGVSRLSNNIITTFNTEQGLASNAIVSITEDKAGNMWFGTEGGGVSQYRGAAFSTLSNNQGLTKSTVLSMAESKNGALWLGTQGGGVTKFDGQAFYSLESLKDISDKSIWSLSTDAQDFLWIGTETEGLSCFNGKTITTYNHEQGLPKYPIRSILPDRQGNLWIGTDGGGMCRFDGQYLNIFSTKEGFAHDAIWCMAEDQAGNIWFGTDGGGIIRYDGTRFLNFTTEQGLANNFIKSLTLDHFGNLWIGTAGGLSIMPAQAPYLNNKKALSLKKGNSIFTNYSKENGLPDQYIASIKEDRQGNLLIGSNFGLWVIEASKVKDFLSKKADEINATSPFFSVYNQFTGFPIRDVNAGFNNGALLVDKAGLIWVGHGSNGITRMVLSDIKKDYSPPLTFIQTVQLNNDRTCWYLFGKYLVDSATKAQQTISTYGRALNPTIQDSIEKHFKGIQFENISRFNQLPIGLILPYQYNNISISFGAVETARNTLVRYQYWLEGYNNSWSPITENTTATFGNIYEGFYTFKVRARSPEGVWSKPISYSFQILPPWWRTWWAFSIYGGCLLLFLQLFINWRERHLRNDKEKLEAIVKLRTAEVVSEKKKSDDLLLNILPEEVAEELKQTGTAHAKYFDSVSVLFTDFVNFTGIAAQMSAQELVEEIHRSFSAFDEIIEKHGLEKIKTIGDAYMAVGGLPIESSDHAIRTVKAALAIRDYVANSQGKFQIRIGVHSGAVVAGIVGVKKYAYDIWGDTVNTASRIESNGEVGKVNISNTTMGLVEPYFKCEYRGKYSLKGIGALDMYWVEPQAEA